MAKGKKLPRGLTAPQRPISLSKLKVQLGPTPSVPGSRLKGTTKPKGKR